MADQILISKLNVTSFIGAFEEERKQPQRLGISMVLETRNGFGGLQDRLEGTVDYAQASLFVKGIALERPRCLIETLAEDIALGLLEKYPLSAVEVEVQKHILPDTEYVGVRIRREAK